MEMKKKFIINTAFYLIIAAIVLVLYKYILPILIPFIIGFCVAALVQFPLNKLKLEQPGHKRTWAIIFCISFYGVIVWLLVALIMKVVTELGGLFSALPDLFSEQFYPFLVEVAHRLRLVLEPIDPALTQWIIDQGESIVQNLGQMITSLSTSAVKIVASGAVSIPGIIVQIIITVVASFYMSVDYQLIVGFLKNLIPESKRSYIVEGVSYVQKAVLVYIKSYSILFCVTFLELWLGLSVLKIPYSLAIGFGIAVFDLMPVLGTGGILLPWTVILLVMGNIPLGIGVGLLYVIITAVRNTLEPRIVGEQIGLHPLATLVAMMLGLKLVGLVGMLLFPVSLVAFMNLRKKALAAKQPDAGQDNGEKA